ncbi:MAG: carboxymuconolactone decarboxylase family protein [Thaumarchaeota archaeon]|nr:carboxymuconolactone decarboxylase family protein [Nitrososphaerota archaeon]
MDDTTRKYFLEIYGEIPESFEIIDKFNPEALDAIARFRTTLIPSKSGDKEVLSAKVKELIVTALEVSAGRGEKGKTHARKAIRVGASPEEVFEAVALCIYLSGMMSWVDSGADAVKAAADEYKKLKAGEEFKWTTEMPR